MTRNMCSKLIMLAEAGDFLKVIIMLKAELSGINWFDDLDDIDLPGEGPDYNLWPEGKKSDGVIYSLLTAAHEARLCKNDGHFSAVLVLNLKALRGDVDAKAQLERLIVRGALSAEAELRAFEKGGNN